MKLDKQLLQWARMTGVALALTVLLGLLGGILVVGQARLLSLIVGQVFLSGQSLQQVQSLLLAFLVLSLVRSGLVWGSEVAANRVAGRVKANLRRRLAAHLLALGPTYVHGERSGELTNTLVEGVEALDAYFRQYLPQLALAALVPITVLLFVFPLDWISGLVLLLTAPLIPVFMLLIGSAAEALTRRQWTSLSRMSAHFLDVLQGLTTLKLLGRSREQIQTIAQVSDQFRGSTMAVLRLTFLSALVLEMVATISTAVVAVQVGLRLLAGHLAFDEAFFVLLLSPEFYLPLRMLGTRFHAGMEGVAAAQRIFEVLETPAFITPEDLGSPDVAPAQVHLHFSDVHYAYDDGQRLALDGFSLELKQGEKVALVGPSGAGKSTVADLLLRFLEPQQGAISVDGHPLGLFSPAAWREQLAWVPQNPYLFHGTVADNIRLARPEADLDQVVWAARQAQAHPFIEAMPRRYDTIIGERGMRLSGGEAQRIALARAFLKDAPLLILDEATANLDPEIEGWIQASMERLLEGRTVLMIAHRLNTLQHADRIVVMDRGRVVEEGTHATLIQQSGLYERLVRAYVADLKSPDWPKPLAEGDLSVSPSRPSPPARPAPENLSGQPAPRKTHRFGTLGRVLRLAAPYTGWMACAVLLGFATIGSGIGLMTTSAYLIARAALQPSIADLQVAIVGVRFFGIARGVFRYLERYVSHDVTFRLLAQLRVWFYGALEPLAPARLMQIRSGDLLARIVADVETLENLFLRVISPPLVALLVMLLATALTGSLALELGVALLGFLLAAGVGLPLLVQALSRPVGRELVRTRAELNATSVDGIQGVADLLAFGREDSHLELVRRLSQNLLEQERRMACLGGLHSALIGLLMSLATLVTLFLAIPLVSKGQLDGVYLAVVALAVMASFEAVLPLPQAAQYLENSLEAARRLFEIVDAEPAVTDPPSPVPLPTSYDLRAEDLRFAYDPGEPPAVDGLSFVLPQGRWLAIVGPSGAGKSTLVRLLLRFWDYQEGRLLLAGRELREFAQEDLRWQIAVVSQDTYLFGGTVEDNLRLARPEASEAEMIEAARQAQIHEFIQSLPEGYRTWIGEQGLRLSGGQRQRLAIARAIMKDAPILILDEPTANLDALTEREVLGALRMLVEGRTTLMITHRLVGLEAADEILVLRAGRMVERGSHQILMQRDGFYRGMWDLQRQSLVVDTQGLDGDESPG